MWGGGQGGILFTSSRQEAVITSCYRVAEQQSHKHILNQARYLWHLPNRLGATFSFTKVVVGWCGGNEKNKNQKTGQAARRDIDNILTAEAILG